MYMYMYSRSTVYCTLQPTNSSSRSSLSRVSVAVCCATGIEKPNFSLTVWDSSAYSFESSAYRDWTQMNVNALLRLRAALPRDRIFYDLFEPVASEFRKAATSHDE